MYVCICARVSARTCLGSGIRIIVCICASLYILCLCLCTQVILALRRELTQPFPQYCVDRKARTLPVFSQDGPQGCLSKHCQCFVCLSKACFRMFTWIWRQLGPKVENWSLCRFQLFVLIDPRHTSFNSRKLVNLFPPVSTVRSLIACEISNNLSDHY